MAAHIAGVGAASQVNVCTRMELDLFDPPPPKPNEPRVFTVTEITRTVRATLEENVGVVWVEGEVSNYRRQASGHQYFTLKDAGSQLACVLFVRAGSWRKEVPLSDGMQVLVRGTMTVYEARGQYQLNVQVVQAGGAGLLHAKFEALKRKLEAEGLFEPARKRPLPRFPTTLAIVTSPTGAAVRDMLNVLARRAPCLRVIVYPVRVQGEGAAQEIAAAIEALNGFDSQGLPVVDVVVVCRGGGSVEDLWAFNEEVVARAIAGSVLPVVSAVGHEIDFTIADFVADLRAPTPSAAAEMIIPDCAELRQHLDHLGSHLRRLFAGEIGRGRSRLDLLKSGSLFREPRTRLDEAAQQLDAVSESLRRITVDWLRAARAGVAERLAALRQHRPDQLLALFRQRFAVVRGQLSERTGRAALQRRQRLEAAASLLGVLAPKSILERGFTMTLRPDGTVISSASAVNEGDPLVTRFRDGNVRSTAESGTTL
jgi:exodeoxyribonuclease VII large subunit